MSEERELVEVVGVIDVSTELCRDGREALQLTTDDGVDYVIRSPRAVKRMYPFAYDNSRVKCTGYIIHDPTGIEVLSVVTYQEVVQEEAQTSKPKAEAKKKTAKRNSAARNSKAAEIPENIPDVDLKLKEIKELDEE